MGLAQLGHREALRGLRCPQLRARGGGHDAPLPVHLFDRVDHWGGGNQGLAAALQGLGAAIKQGWFGQATGPVMDQDVLSICGKRRQTAGHRLLTRGSPLDPAPGLAGLQRLQQRFNRLAVAGLAYHPQPGNRLTSQGGFEGPCQQRPALQGQQQLVALSPHAPATASGNNQQMQASAVQIHTIRPLPVVG